MFQRGPVQPALGAWDVSKVTVMETANTRASSTAFEGVERVKVATGTCFNTRAVQPDLGTWDVSRVTNMGYMFRSANRFNQTLGHGTCPK